MFLDLKFIMVNFNENYWLTIEPYVYVSIKEKDVFLYNTLDGAIIESSIPCVLKIIKEITDELNGGVILIEGITLQEKEVYQFISELRLKFMGDIISCSLSEAKPMQLLPVLNLQDDIKRLQMNNSSIGKNVMHHLHEINLFLENPCNYPNKIYPYSNKISGLDDEVNGDVKFNHSLLQMILNQVSGVKDLIINVLAKDLLSHSQFYNIISLLNEVPVKKHYFFHYDNTPTLEMLKLLVTDKTELVISVNSFVKNDKMDLIFDKINDINVQYRFSFLIFDEIDLINIDAFLKKYPILKYELVPIYNGSNIDFFKQNVYLSEEDILSKPISMREIFIHQTLNITDFGKISILPNGEAYSNLNLVKLGNMSEQTILDILYNELEIGESWFRIRNQRPCLDCHYCWLCPGPSNYELMIGKYNLCTVKNNCLIN